ncbi:hypothetical protein [Sphaerisporangium perillae]|uniref:hypothetical protein n=1 Tax=Sphaerisporangium perillae TaxID=2935860 RepID=UPI00200DB66C|nr:hypothetical protein [Sphaerisporangium perillae]
MRVVWLWAVLAGLLAALTGPVATDDLRRRADALIGEHPEIWAGARIIPGERSLLVVAATARADAVTPGRGDPSPEAAGAPGPLGLADLARRADRASLIVARVAGPVRPLILVPATTEQAAALAAPAAVGGLAAVAAADHVIVEPRSFARLTGTGRDVVLAHELTHVAMGAAMDGRTPKWLVEGFADYVGYLHAGLPVARAAAELAEEVRAGAPPEALPGPGAFAAGSARLAQAYEEAWLACRYVAGRFGERALVTLYRESRRGDPDTALTRTLGMSEEEFTAAWREYVRRQLA